MLIRIGLENGNASPSPRSLAWSLDFPGVAASGVDGSSAMLALPCALLMHQDWANRHAGADWMDLGDFDMRLEETCETRDVSSAWFQDDRRPLDRVDAVRGVEQLGWSRADLLMIVRELPAQKLDALYPNQPRSIRAILEHIGATEGWLLDRFHLGGAPLDPSADVYERIQAVRLRTSHALLDLAGVQQVFDREGELWSPRKLLRRVLWHELDAIAQIIQLV